MSKMNFSIPNANWPLSGIVTGGQPAPEQLEAARDDGVRTVVNLCPDGECDWDEEHLVAELGMRYVSIPIRGAADITAANAEYLREILHDQSALPMIIHCASSNRVGGLFAAKAFYLDGCDLDESMQQGRSAGLTKLESVLRGCFVR